MAGTHRVVAKATAAAAVAGGGVVLLAGSASAQEAPPDPIGELGARLQERFTSTALRFIQDIEPVDSPNVAETEATSSGAVSTAIQGDGFVFGRSEATPTSAKVTILRLGETDILTKEGDADGGHYGGVLAPAGQVIDWVNDKTCPSGAHGGEELCITFLGSSATTNVTEDAQPVSVELSTRSVVRAALPASIPTTLINLVIPADATVTATGQSQGTSAQSAASFHLVKASKGGDSIALLPTSASSGSFELGPSTVTTSPFTVRILGVDRSIPSLTLQLPGLPRTCQSEGSASVVSGSGIFAGIDGLVGTPKSSSNIGVGDDCEVPVTSPA